jgi:hypothetical protein
VLDIVPGLDLAGLQERTAATLHLPG